MRYIRFFGDAGYAGTDYETYHVYDDNRTDEELDQISEELGHLNGEDYAYLHTGWDEDFADEEDEDMYWQDVTWNWEEVTKEAYNEWKAENG